MSRLRLLIRHSAILFEWCWLLCLLALPTHAGALTVSLGAEDDWLPFSGVQMQQPTGFAEDIIRAAYAAQHIEVRFIALPYARCLAEARTGAVSGCFDTVRNSLREPLFLWPNHPLFNARINIYSRTGSQQNDLSPTDLHGKTVGVTNDYEYGQAFDADQSIVRSVSPNDMLGIRKLLAGRIDYLVLYERVANHLIRQHPELAGKLQVVGKTGEPALYIAFSRQTPEAAYFMRQFDAGMEKILHDGTYQRIDTNWQ